MTVVTTTTYQCDGCLSTSPDPKFIEAHYDISKHRPQDHGKPPTKYERDYCARCAPQIREAQREGAFVITSFKGPEKKESKR